MRKITRREALALSAAGGAGLFLPSSPIHVTKEETPKLAVSSQKDLSILNGCIVTGDEPIDKINREADRLWSEAVEKALAEGSGITTVANPSSENIEASESASEPEYIYTNEKEYREQLQFAYYLGALYRVRNVNQVFEFTGHRVFISRHITCFTTIQIVGYTYTIINGGTTFAVRTTLRASCYINGIQRTAIWQAYSEFHYYFRGFLY